MFIEISRANFALSVYSLLLLTVNSETYQYGESSIKQRLEPTNAKKTIKSMDH